MLIQRQNINFKGFKVEPNAKPFLQNGLPRVIGYNENFLSEEPVNILRAFKKRMTKLAAALEKKQASKGLDIVLTTENNLPAFILKNKSGQKVGEPLPLCEIYPEEVTGQKAPNVYTLIGAKDTFNSIGVKAHEWLNKTFPATTQPPKEISTNEISKTHLKIKLNKILTGKRPANPHLPKTLTEAIEKVFGQ